LTFGLKILRLFRLNVFFEADIVKGWCYLSMNNYSVKTPQSYQKSKVVMWIPTLGNNDASFLPYYLSAQLTLMGHLKNVRKFWKLLFRIRCQMIFKNFPKFALKWIRDSYSSVEAILLLSNIVKCWSNRCRQFCD